MRKALDVVMVVGYLGLSAYAMFALLTDRPLNSIIWLAASCAFSSVAFNIADRLAQTSEVSPHPRTAD